MGSTGETPLFQRLTSNGLQQLLQGVHTLTGGQREQGNRQNNDEIVANAAGTLLHFSSPGNAADSDQSRGDMETVVLQALHVHVGQNL